MKLGLRYLSATPPPEQSMNILDMFMCLIKKENDRNE